MKILRNYLLNTGYQLLTIILPIITMPYVTRIFNPSEIGINSYSASIAQYFVLLASLGVSLYGSRSISYVRDDYKKVNRTFWSIFFTISFTTIISLIMYYFFVFIIIKKNINIFLIQSISIIAVMFDITWLFSGMEDFKRIVSKNTIVKILGVIAIFTFVKKSEDLLIYILILVLTNLLGILSMWIYVRKYICEFYFDLKSIFSHLIPLIKLYIPYVSIQVYAVLDKTMVGVFSNQSQVGMYDMSQKIIKMVLTVVTSLAVVMIPRISNYIANKKNNEVEKYIKNAIIYMSYLSFPMAFGLMAISDKLVGWFFGPNYGTVAQLISIGSLMIIPITWSNIIGIQYMLPLKKESKFTKSVVGGAIINLILNLYLIRKFGAIGAIFASVVSEITVLIIQLLLIRNEIELISIIKSTWRNGIASIIMYFVVIICSKNFNATILTNIIQIMIGIVTYLISMELLKSKVQEDAKNKIINWLINKTKKVKS